MTNATRACADCNADISHRRWNAKRCEACSTRRSAANSGKSPVRITRECATCGTPFTAKRRDSRCCSRTCTVARLNAVHNGKRYIRHTPRPCPSCGMQFTPLRSDRIACSRLCYQRLTRTHTPTWHDKTCSWCGKDFHSKRSDAAFCSRTCAQRQHYAVNMEAVKAAVATWRAANADRCKIYAAQYKAKRRGWEGDGPGVSFADWTRTINRHKGCCAYCGALPDKLHMDHVVPLSRGGAHAVGNMLPACEPCNLSKGAKLLVEWRRR